MKEKVMRRRFKVSVGWGTEGFTDYVEATDHRNAVQLTVNKRQLPGGTEVRVVEVPRPPAESTYIVFEHTSRQIEMKA